MKGLLAAVTILAAGCSFDAPGAGSPDPAMPDAGTQLDPPTVDAPPTARCGPAYNYDYNFHKYRLVQSGMSWMQAKSSCEADGGYLLKIETAAEDQQVEDAFFLGPQEVWIGLRDINGDGNYFWTDGTPPSAFSHWDGGPPNASSPDCVAKNTFSTNGRWYTRDCAINRALICECDP